MAYYSCQLHDPNQVKAQHKGAFSGCILGFRQMPEPQFIFALPCPKGQPHVVHLGLVFR